MTRFVVVPQWQGSPAARAMLLTDGASAIAGDLPRAHTTVLDIPLEAGDTEGTAVQRLSSLRRIRALVEDAVRTANEPVVAIGGDCGVSVGAIGALPGALDDVALIWCDAHPDLHTPATSPSGAYSGMALRAALGDPDSPLPGRAGLSPDRVILVGARVAEDAEEDHLTGSGITRVDDLTSPDVLAHAVAATGAARVYVHIDVDVIDPAEFAGVSAPAPFGIAVADLVAALRAVRARAPIAGATIAGFAPRSPVAAVDDLGAVLRLIGAVA
ncbi:arginase family protein [Microbacterium pseudoresistens]|uniref:Arginase n=1 Tax=Microbacterium pseudoresistens TaxID=640634 RepID=A0A7Y9EWC5_9MICO|nr:arginase family protein [Microbacterium pseudoresistens]NYD55031.1 arginase [Microbacterium pseudoresistens]